MTVREEPPLAEQLQAIVEATPECIKTVAADGTLLQINAAGLAMLGAAAAEQAIGRSIYEFVATEDRSRFRAFNEAVCRGERGTLEFDMVTVSGERRHMESSAVPLRRPGGALALLAITRDVTDARQLHELASAVHEDDPQALYEKIVDAAASLLRSDFASLQMLYPERGAGGELRLLAFRGFNADAARFWTWVRADSQSTCGEALRSGRRAVATDVERCGYMAGSEDLATYLATGIRAVQTTPLVARSGRLVGMVSTHWRRPHQPEERELRLFDILARQAADLLERSRNEEALREATLQGERQRRLYEAILTNTPDLAYVFDLEHRFSYANEGLLRMWGRTWDEAIGKTCLELGYEPWHAEMHDREIERVIATKQPVRGEVPFTGTNGRRIYDYILVPVIGPDGKVEAVAGTTRDVTDYRESERRKDEFIATLSHELRNPLAPLRNGLQLLELAARGEPSIEPLRELMERQVNHLVRLVDDLLELSRVSRGAMELRRERVEVAAVVRNALETSQPLLKAARHALSLALPGEPLWVDGDPVRLAQILANLLNNAAKYTDPGGRIAIAAKKRNGTVEIAVRDNGCGIAPELLPRLFEMFARGGGPDRAGQGGLGIGLALARRLAEMHGGSLAARSEGPGRGAEFTLTLPLAARPAAAAPAAAPARGRLAPRRILVVDDNRDAAHSLGMVLKFLGADVQVAHDGGQALEAFRSYEPGVVFLDIGMPGMDGYEVARRMRASHGEPRPAIIALTGWGQEADRQRARDAGFDHHLVKPADLAALQVLLASLETPSLSRAS